MVIIIIIIMIILLLSLLLLFLLWCYLIVLTLPSFRVSKTPSITTNLSSSSILLFITLLTWTSLLNGIFFSVLILIFKFLMIFLSQGHLYRIPHRFVILSCYCFPFWLQNFEEMLVFTQDAILLSGMLNVSPIGRNCTQAEREAFLEYDTVKFSILHIWINLLCMKEHKIRETMVGVLKVRIYILCYWNFGIQRWPWYAHSCQVDEARHC